MSTPSEDSRLSDYARKLRWALSVLPEGDRDDIVDKPPVTQPPTM